MATAIRIEDLGKKYTLRHQKKGGGYVTLRDVLTDSAKNLFKRQPGQTSTTTTEEFWALQNLNLTVEQGDKLAIIGHNGAGKSTLLKLLSQITAPTTGRINLYGRVASLLEVGTGFHPELTGRENIYLNGSILGMSHGEVRRKFDEIVDFSGVEKFLDTPVKRYSSGMRMRLGFAVAAHLESEILIIDEVLAVGDAEFQRKCLGKMDAISKSEGRTILFVSHNMTAVHQLCNKGLILNKGKLAFTGSASDAVKFYENKGAFSEHSINILNKNSQLDLISVSQVGDIQSNKDWRFQLKFNANTNFGKCYFNFGIYNEKFFPITDYRGSLIDQTIDIQSGHFMLECIIPGMNLNLGSYQLIFYIGSKSGDTLFEAQSIPIAYVTEVPEQNFSSALIAPNIRVEYISY